MVDLAVAHIAISIEHYDHLFAGPNSFGNFGLKIGEKGLLRASIIILVVEMVDVLAIRTVWPIRETGAVRSNDLERNRLAALVAHPGAATETGGVSAAAGDAMSRLRGRE